MNYNIIITGSKSFNDYDRLKIVCDHYLNALAGDSDSENDITVITGSDGNGELLAQQYANERGYEVSVYSLDVEQYGNFAAHVRNSEMVGVADGAICFWDGSSKGVKTTINLCKNKGIACQIIRFKKTK